MRTHRSGFGGCDPIGRVVRAAGATAVTLAVLALPTPVVASAQPQSGDIDLRVQTSARLDGAAGAAAGEAVAGPGDVNGDGRGDLVVGAPYSGYNGRAHSGSVFVTFGTSLLGNVELGGASGAGFRIDGAAAGNYTGFTVAGAGDANGDGLQDIVIGARLANNNGRAHSGSAYVVYGKADPSPVDLADLGDHGFRIDGAAADEGAGFWVAGAGDVNGDGLSDVILDARFAGYNGRTGSGSAYVVFGKPNGAPVDLAGLGTAGFRIDGATSGDNAGYSVAGAGDINGDGRADVLVGAVDANNNDRRGSGSAYVVYGRAGGASVDLGALGDGGYRIDGAVADDEAGWSVAGPGDVNYDGRPDVVVGARSADPHGSASGSVYVVFGTSHSQTVDLAGLGKRGFRIDGAAITDQAGWSVAGAGDVNRDGRRDILVGAIGASNNARRGSGSAYVVYGKRALTTVNLGALATRGFRMDGAASGDRTGDSLSGAGDVNGDALPDVIIGAPGADNNGQSGSGSAYVAFGCLDCDQDHYFADADCDDRNPAIHKGAVDIPGDHVDQDCNGKDAAFPRLSPAFPHGIQVYPEAGYTVFTALSVQPARSGSTIRVSCRVIGRRCPFAAITRRVKRSSPAFNLIAVVRRVRFPIRSVLEVRVTRPGWIGAVRRFTMRAGKQAPRQVDLCLRPGTTRPTVCKR